MNQSVTTRLAKALALFVAFVIVLLPFNEFLTTWIASNFGHLDFWRVYKELLITLCLPFVIYLVWASKPLRSWFSQSWLFRLIILYTLLCFVIGVWAYDANRVNLFALSDGLISDLRFLLFFLVCFVVSFHTGFLKRHWQALLLWPASLVVLFGLAQLLLPYDFLRHFGYGPKTIPAYATVDQKIQYRRIQSTLRGANPLGAYLVLVIPAFFLGIKKRLWQRGTLIAISLVVMFFTYSRSAYIGLAIALALLFYWVIDNKKKKKQTLLIYLIVVLIAVVGVVSLRYNQTSENIFFHTSSNSSAATSSNTVRFNGLKSGLDQAARQPFGGGVGTAGPSSVHNDHPARIAENYFVQIAQETGWLGLALFLAINVLVAIKLWLNKNDALSRLLLASLVGISFIGLVSHVWSDDTLSLLWWGLAGIALSPAILKHKSNSHEANKKTGKDSLK